jgi:pimeloyl-ACP methyl ester carboxylesterase
MNDQIIKASDGRDIGCRGFGDDNLAPVIWCHGGPGSRLESAWQSNRAKEAGFRLIGIDRPGYGLSTPLPGRQICDWSADALAVADHLGIESFYTVGVSTGGAYALATAALASDRVLGVIACCTLTDMRALSSNPELGTSNDYWETDSRGAAIEIALNQFGIDGSKMMEANPDAPPVFTPGDLEVLFSPDSANSFNPAVAFENGVEGYVDDRLADGPATGWGSFDIDDVAAPVIILHGEDDLLLPASQARHTAAIVKDSELRVVPGHGHLTILREVVGALADLRDTGQKVSY